MIGGSTMGRSGVQATLRTTASFTMFAVARGVDISIGFCMDPPKNLFNVGQWFMPRQGSKVGVRIQGAGPRIALSKR